MVARVKDKGRNELRSFRKRVLQTAALGRISKADADWLVEKVDEIERRVSTMHEKPEYEREFLR